MGTKSWLSMLFDSKKERERRQLAGGRPRASSNPQQPTSAPDRQGSGGNNHSNNQNSSSSSNNNNSNSSSANSQKALIVAGSSASASGSPSTVGCRPLVQLPKKMLDHILGYLALRDLIAARAVCITFKQLVDSEWYSKELVNSLQKMARCTGFDIRRYIASSGGTTAKHLHIMSMAIAGNQNPALDAMIAANEANSDARNSQRTSSSSAPPMGGLDNDEQDNEAKIDDDDQKKSNGNESDDDDDDDDDEEEEEEETDSNSEKEITAPSPVLENVDEQSKSTESDAVHSTSQERPSHLQVSRSKIAGIKIANPARDRVRMGPSLSFIQRKKQSVEFFTRALTKKRNLLLSYLTLDWYKAIELFVDVENLHSSNFTQQFIKDFMPLSPRMGAQATGPAPAAAPSSGGVLFVSPSSPIKPPVSSGLTSQSSWKFESSLQVTRQFDIVEDLTFNSAYLNKLLEQKTKAVMPLKLLFLEIPNSLAAISEMSTGSGSNKVKASRLTIRKLLSPITNRLDLRDNIQQPKLHTAVLLGNWLLEWNGTSLVVPRRVIEYEVPNCAGITICNIDMRKAILKVADVIVHYNSFEKYDPLKCNSQTFVDDVFKALKSLISTNRKLVANFMENKDPVDENAAPIPNLEDDISSLREEDNLFEKDTDWYFKESPFQWKTVLSEPFMDLVKKIRTQGYSEMFWNCKNTGAKGAAPVSASLPAALLQQQQQQQQASNSKQSKDKGVTKITFSVHSQLDEMAQRLLGSSSEEGMDREAYHLLRIYDQVFWIRFLRDPANSLWCERREGCYFGENKQLYLQPNFQVPAIVIKDEQ